MSVKAVTVFAIRDWYRNGALAGEKSLWPTVWKSRIAAVQRCGRLGGTLKTEGRPARFELIAIRLDLPYADS